MRFTLSLPPFQSLPEASPERTTSATIGNRVPSRRPALSPGRSSYRVAHFPQLVEQWHPSLNGDLTPGDVTFGSGKRIWWKCPVAVDHEWPAPPARRTRGSGCPFCDNQRLSITNCLATRFPLIAAEWHPTKNGKVRPRSIIAGTGRKFWWRCSEDLTHEWRTSPGKRIEGSGCPYCAHVTVAPSNCLATLRPELAAQWHPARNGPLRPTDVIVGSTRTVWWRCPVARDHVWQTTCHARATMDEGCPFCANRQVARDNTLAARFPDLASEWHPTRNGSMGPEDIVPGSKQIVWWRCGRRVAHTWKASVARRTRDGTGCPICLGRALTPATSLAALAPAVAAEWHPAKNGGITPSDVLAGSGKAYWWRCPVARDHVWRAPVHRRVEGTCCPFCLGRRPSRTNTLATQFPDVAREWHALLNAPLTPRDVVAGTKRKVWWTCPEGHDWQAPVNQRTRDGQRCPACRALATHVPAASPLTRSRPGTRKRLGFPAPAGRK
jgi:Probable Zinc-ribbon domain